VNQSIISEDIAFRKQLSVLMLSTPASLKIIEKGIDLQKQC